MKRPTRLIPATLLVVGLLLNAGCQASAPQTSTPPAETPPPVEVTPTDAVATPQGNQYARYPFPHQGQYGVMPMLPTDKTAQQLSDMTIALFKKILLNDMIVDTKAPKTTNEFRMVIRHYQQWELEDIDVSHINVSESQGYGMMMMAYMAGSEDELGLKPSQWIYGSTSLHDYYDAMLRTVQHFPSITGDLLFSWELKGYPRDGKNQTGYKVVNGVKTAPFKQDPKDGDSATDGDMDIIYSLLLADQQWGSDGAYNYKRIALDMLGSLWDYCVHKQYHTLLLGDWAAAEAGTTLGDATRTSDFILDHLKVFAQVDNAHDWQSVIDATYGVIQAIRDAQIGKGYDNGLLPDFVIRSGDTWAVPKGEVLESDEDPTFAYNACRTPWRLGTDYLLFGDTQIGDKSLLSYIVKPMDDFAKAFTKGNLDKLGPLKLNGKLYEGDDSDTFAPPFLVTGVGNQADQAWVNTLWSFHGFTEYLGDNYADYYKIFIMLTASGNYWLPTSP